MQLVHFEWLQYAAGVPRQEALTASLEVLQAHNSHHLLIDARNLPVVSPEDERWSREVHQPRMVKWAEQTSPLYLCVAVHAALSQMCFKEILTSNDPNFVTYFVKTVEEAQEWLKSRGAGG